jgi:hypothetical protein
MKLSQVFEDFRVNNTFWSFPSVSILMISTVLIAFLCTKESMVVTATSSCTSLLAARDDWILPPAGARR